MELARLDLSFQERSSINPARHFERSGELRPMKIVQINSDYPPHVLWGSAIYCAELAEGLAAAGDDVLVVVPHFDGPSERVIENGVTVVRAGVTKPALTKDASAFDAFSATRQAVNTALLRAALEEHPSPAELIHVHQWGVYPVAEELKRAWGCPLVTTVHIVNEDIQEIFANPELIPLAVMEENAMLMASESVILPSRFVDERIPVARLPRHKRHIINHGINLEKHETRRPQDYYDDLKFRLAKSNDVVLFVGRIISIKGWKELLEAFHNVVAERPQTTLVIVGTGNEIPVLERMASTMENIVVTGFLARDTILDFYQVADVVVVPSRYEVYGLVVAEALASGCPVIASDVGGIRELIEPGQNGVLVPVHWESGTSLPRVDTAQLGDAILSVLNNGEWAAQLRLRARDYAKRTLSQERMVNTTRNVYQALCSTPWCSPSVSLSRPPVG